MRHIALNQATVVSEIPCDFEYRDGLVYVTDPSIAVVRAFRLHTFYATFRNAAQCMQEIHATVEAEIIEFPGASAA